ncbi:MAG: hypothetical protein KGZ53_09595 [Peptococcaceae bacterium]|nr:hypothetical protein [Peptococcaceae bacterium]
MIKMFSLVLTLILCLNLALPALAEEPVVDTQKASTSQGQEKTEINDANMDVTEAEAISQIIYDLGAETITEIPANPVSAGVTPDSAFYFLDKLIEDIQLALTKTPQAKATLLTAFSQERLAEIEALDPQKLNQYIDGLLNEISVTLQQASDAVTKAVEKGVEVGDLITTLEQVAQQGNSLELPEVVRRTEKIDEIKSKIETTTKSIKVQAAVVRGIDEEIIIELRTKGLGYGQIALLTKLASTLSIENQDDDEAEEAVAKDNRLEQVIAKFAENKSIGQTMKAFNTNPGQVNKEAKKQWLVRDSKDEAKEHDDDESENDDDDDDNRERLKWGSKSKGNNASKGKGK